MKKGGELEKVTNAALAAGVLDIHKILKDIRQESDSGQPAEVITVEIPVGDLEHMRELLVGDMFRSEDELLQVTSALGLLTMKFALDHPDDFDLDLFFSETEDNMEKEGW
jgi:hypothetical protein